MINQLNEINKIKSKINNYQQSPNNNSIQIDQEFEELKSRYAKMIENTKTCVLFI